MVAVVKQTIRTAKKREPTAIRELVIRVSPEG